MSLPDGITEQEVELVRWSLLLAISRFLARGADGSADDMRRNLDALKVSLQEPTQVGAMVLASLILEAHELRRSGALSTDELLKLHDGTPLDDLRENLVRIARELSAVSARLPEGQDQQVNDLVHELVKQTKALGPTI